MGEALAYTPRYVTGAPQPPLRAAITAAYRRAEADCLPPLLELATLPAAAAARTEKSARSLVARLAAQAAWRA